MRPPKPRGVVQRRHDPPHPPHKHSADLIRRALASSSASVKEIVHKKDALRSSCTSGTGVKAGDFRFHHAPADAIQSIQISRIQKPGKALPHFRVPVIPKPEIALLSRHVLRIEGDPKQNAHCYQGSSSSAPAQKMAHCGICMTFKPFSKFFSIEGCKHSYCSKCLASYIESKVNMNATRIKCPETECKDGKLEPLACKSMITKIVFDQWCDALCESVVGKKFYCPFKDCSALLTDERGQDVILESECPHCHRLFCAQCMVPWHTGLSCRKFREMAELEKDKKHDMILVELAKNSKWQRCPICKMYVEKLSGCMFIKCRCGSSFCYGCGSVMEVDHYCMKCRR